MIELRPFQKAALEKLASPDSSHLICISPTGSGKSLIYEKHTQTPGTRTLLITPLIALARQQHKNFLDQGIKAGLGAGPVKEGPPRLESHESGAWIISPEKIFHPLKEFTLERLRYWKPNFLVVDECHCLWEWGEDFRPAFRSIPELIKEFQIPKSVWLTATLPPQAKKDLKSLLPQPIHEIGNFRFPENMKFSTQRVPYVERSQFLTDWVMRQKTPGIIFTWTRKSAERLTQLLSHLDKHVITYHAGMSAEERRNSEIIIQKQIPDVVISTSAFGMGMNYTHLKWVLLWSAPPSLLTLAQTVGRVGRSGDSSQSVVLWDYDDFRMLEWMFKENKGRGKEDLLQTLQVLAAKGSAKKNVESYFNGKTGRA